MEHSEYATTERDGEGKRGEERQRERERQREAERGRERQKERFIGVFMDIILTAFLIFLCLFSSYSWIVPFSSTLLLLINLVLLRFALRGATRSHWPIYKVL